jgi:2-keto-4-pentenoate hydratase
MHASSFTARISVATLSYNHIKIQEREQRVASAIIQTVADRLAGAYAGDPVAPIAADLPDRDIETAYQVQLLQLESWVAAGRRLAGRKVGLTSAAVQAQLGVGEPDFGHLLADMIYGENEPLPLSRLHQPRIEAEIALILGSDLDFPDVCVADLIQATAWVLPALEVVGSRISDWQISIVDTVADNASSGLLVLGGPARRLDGLDLVRCAMAMTVNGELVSSGQGSACLGSPLNAAAWLARRSHGLGRPLRAGEVVLTGALGPMVPVFPGDRIEAQIDGLGSVSTLLAQE